MSESENINTEYLAYIPELFSNKVVNAIVITIIPAIFFTLASYAHLYFKHSTLLNAIILSSFFAILEYIFRVPITKYSSIDAGMSALWMQIIWIALTLILAYVTDIFIPRPPHHE